jgi:hypothetical protein
MLIILCTLVIFLFKETNNPTNEVTILDSLKWAQVKMMKKVGTLFVLYQCWDQAREVWKVMVRLSNLWFVTFLPNLSLPMVGKMLGRTGKLWEQRAHNKMNAYEV